MICDSTLIHPICRASDLASRARTREIRLARIEFALYILEELDFADQVDLDDKRGGSVWESTEELRSRIAEIQSRYYKDD